MASAETVSDISLTQSPTQSGDSRMLPTKLYGKILFWFAAAVIPFFLTVSIAYLRPVVFSNYLPYLAVSCGLIASYFKTKGLTFCYFLLGGVLYYFYPSIPDGEKVWQMTVLLTLAVELFTLLLVAEEIEAIVSECVGTSPPVHETVHAKNDFEEKDVVQQALEQEIERLKQEAEQRRIEREHLLKKVEYVHSEIEILTRQKDSWIAQARETRSRIREEEGRVKGLTSQIHDLQTSVLRLQSLPREKEIEVKVVEVEDQKKIQELSAQVQQLQDSLLELQTRPPEKEVQFVQDETKVRELTSRLEQAQKEFAHLKALPKEVEVRLVQDETQIRDLTTRLERTQNELERLKSVPPEVKIVEVEDERRIKELLDEVHRVNHEKSRVVEQERERTLAFQEAMLTLQFKQLHSIDSKEFIQSEGRYRQLRAQFDEKSQILNQTRKELFKTENALLTLERKCDLEELESTASDHILFEQERRCAELEEEVRHLEEIISSSL